MNSVTQEILRLRVWYQHEYGDNPLWINHGRCQDFAEDLKTKFPEAKMYWAYSGKFTPYHWFVKIGNRYYDAEAPEGVDRTLDLPTFKRSKSKGLRLEIF
jgi:hypothetical protein